MKTILKLTLVATLLVAGSSAYAQKFGYIKMDDLISLMPENDSAMVKLQALQKELSEQLEAVQVEFNTKALDYQKNAATLSDAVKALRQKELDGVQQRIADLQSREAQITQRVSELRAMFSNAFSGFGMNDLSVVNAVDEGEPSDAQSDHDAQHDDETAAPADADTRDAVENDSAAETEPEGDAESADASQNN